MGIRPIYRCDKCMHWHVCYRTQDGELLDAMEELNGIIGQYINSGKVRKTFWEKLKDLVLESLAETCADYKGVEE